MATRGSRRTTDWGDGGSKCVFAREEAPIPDFPNYSIQGGREARGGMMKDERPPHWLARTSSISPMPRARQSAAQRTAQQHSTGDARQPRPPDMGADSPGNRRRILAATRMVLDSIFDTLEATRRFYRCASAGIWA